MENTQKNKNFDIVVACSNYGIGKDGLIPWRLKEDIDYFKILTSETTDTKKQNCVIMGRKTYFSIPKKFRPLSDRINIIISKNSELKRMENIPLDVIVKRDFESALETASARNDVERIFVIGGSQVYEEAIKRKECERIYLTEIEQPVFECDTFFPKIGDSYTLERSSFDKKERDIVYRFLVYKRK